MRAIILAGGKGTRLRPYTTLIPKPLVPLGGETSVIEIIIKQLAQHGFKRVTVAVNHLSNLIKSYLGDGKKYKIKLTKLFHENNIEYGYHYPKPLNKLSALKKYFLKKKYINSETLANECISLPIDPNLSKANTKLIIKLVNSI